MLDFYLTGEVDKLSEMVGYFSDERRYGLVFLFAESFLVGLEGREGVVGGFSLAEGACLRETAQHLV